MISKFFLTLLAGLIITTGVIAQKLPPIPLFQFGIKAGANITRIGNESFNDQFNFGYHAGAFAVIKLNKTFQLQPEALFSQVNTKTAEDFSEVTDVNNLKGVSLNYLSIPLILNISPSRLLSFQAGPQYGILMDGKNDLIENGKAAFKNGSFSVLGGLQVNLLHFKINARYVVGLSDISELPDKKDWKNEGFQISVGWRII